MDARRQARAREIAARSRLTCKDGVWNVPSSQTMHPASQVRLDPDSCTCDDFTLRRELCKHILAVRLFTQQPNAPARAFTADDIAALKRPTYPQDWPNYAVETAFAVDSSGFSVCKFIKWYDEKYGNERSGRDWVKVHICWGVQTNVVTAVRVLDRDAGDSPQFKPLLETTAEHFTVKEASADKAYSGRENVEAVTALGGLPALAFRSNATGAAGGDFEKLFFYYCLKREGFLKTYHRRSNVESTFSMVKRKFGDAVRAKTDVAMRNEVLAKFVCHNICCVIASWYELDIEPDFFSGGTCTNNRAVAQILPFKND